MFYHSVTTYLTAMIYCQCYAACESGMTELLIERDSAGRPNYGDLRKAMLVIKENVGFCKNKE